MCMFYECSFIELSPTELNTRLQQVSAYLFLQFYFLEHNLAYKGIKKTNDNKTNKHTINVDRKEDRTERSMGRLLNLPQMRSLSMMQPKDSAANLRELEKLYLPEALSAFLSPVLLLCQYIYWIILNNKQCYIESRLEGKKKR